MPIERRVSVFELPHPALRKKREFEAIKNYNYKTQQLEVDQKGNNWPKIFTDARKIENKGGPALSWWKHSGEKKEHSFRLCRYCSAYQAKLTEISQKQNYGKDQRTRP